MAKSPARRAPPTPTRLLQATRTELRHHSGPLPAPDDLARYEQLLPGAGERIFSMAEIEQQHRIGQDRQTLDSDIEHRAAVLALQASNARGVFRANLLGQMLGGLIALACAGSAIYALLLDKPWYVIATFLGLPVAAIVKAVHARITRSESA